MLSRNVNETENFPLWLHNSMMQNDAKRKHKQNAE
jgi:hypothetical protein